jgi:hypothetical protein
VYREALLAQVSGEALFDRAGTAAVGISLERVGIAAEVADQ